jgi:hypothetical protein
MCSGCAESYLLPNRKIQEREEKHRERETQTQRKREEKTKLSLMSFMVTFCDLALSFC